MTIEEYCDFLDTLDKSGEKSYLVMVKKAYETSPNNFVKCVNISRLNGVDKNHYEYVVNAGNYRDVAVSMCVSNRWAHDYVKRLWRWLLQGGKFLSNSISTEYAAYMCSLVEYSTGGCLDRLKLMYARDAEQFSTLTFMANLSRHERQFITEYSKEYSLITNRQLGDIKEINRIHELFYKVCRRVCEKSVGE